MTHARRSFFPKSGRLLWRRALSPDELTEQVQVAHTNAGKLNDFYAGLKESLAGVLTSPNFLFRVLEGEVVPGKADTYELTPYSKASDSPRSCGTAIRTALF